MKIVLAQHPECDFLGHAISVGCYENNHQIFELPYIKSLHGEPDDWYILPDGKRGYSGVPGYLQKTPLSSNEKNEEEVLEAAKDADLIIAHSLRSHSLRSLDKIISYLGKNPGNIVVACGEDHSFINHEIIEKYSPLCYFKRELDCKYSLSEYKKAYGVDVLPLPFASFTRGFPDVDDTQKRDNFFLSLGNTNPIRNLLLGKCLEANISNSYIATDGNNPIRRDHPLGSRMEQMLPWDQYIVRQAQAKVGAICVGFGRDTLHMMELLAFEVAALYMDTEIHYPYPFKNDEHCVYFNRDCSDVGALIRHLLENDEYRRGIARAGRDHCRRYHSTKARATYLTEIAMKIIGGEKIDSEAYGL